MLRRFSERLVRTEFCEEAFEIAASEFPLEWAGNSSVVLFESQEPLFHFGERGEVIGGEHLALDDREVDLDLIEPTGVHRSVDRGDRGPPLAHAVSAALPAMRGAIVEDPEDASCRAIGFPRHDLSGRRSRPRTRARTRARTSRAPSRPSAAGRLGSFIRPYRRPRAERCVSSTNMNARAPGHTSLGGMCAVPRSLDAVSPRPGSLPSSAS